jgi:hypothetical protein
MSILRLNRARRPNHFFDVLIYSIRINAVQHEFAASRATQRSLSGQVRCAIGGTPGIGINAADPLER